MFYLRNIHCMTRTESDIMKWGITWHIKRGFGLNSFTWVPLKLKNEKKITECIRTSFKRHNIGFKMVNEPFQIYNLSLNKNSQGIQQKNSYIC